MIADEYLVAAQIFERKAGRIERMFILIGGVRPPIAVRHDLGLRDRSPPRTTQNVAMSGDNKGSRSARGVAANARNALFSSVRRL